MLTIQERFWSKVEKTNKCWFWMAGSVQSPRGGRYGVFSIGKKIKYAHRISWELEKDEIPLGMQVNHICHNTLCVRLSHLYLGTQKDNMRDMQLAGRDNYVHPSIPGRKGEQSNLAKLTTNGIKEIRNKYLIGNITQKQLAEEYRSTQTNIGLIVRRETWKHV